MDMTIFDNLFTLTSWTFILTFLIFHAFIIILIISFSQIIMYTGLPKIKHRLPFVLWQPANEV